MIVKTKKTKRHKMCVIKKNLNLKIMKTVSKQKKNDIHSLKRDNKEFIRNNNLLLKTHEKFKSERHNI